MVLPRGLQPSMLYAASGTLVVQAQVPEKPFPSNRMTYFSAMSTVVSRDGDEVDPSSAEARRKRLESGGGAVQLRDGTILALDTYITPGKREGVGQLYTSKDDWRTLQGPKDVPFDLPRGGLPRLDR